MPVKCTFKASKLLALAILARLISCQLATEANYMSLVRHPTLFSGMIRCDQAILSACFTSLFCFPLHIFLISPCKTQESCAIVIGTDIAQYTKNKCSPAAKETPIGNIEAKYVQGTMIVAILVSCPALLACRLAILVCLFASRVCLPLVCTPRSFLPKLLGPRMPPYDC
jgi:hypothetical protein